jgi:hypothetical protein
MSVVTLRKGRLSAGLRKRFHDYHSARTGAGSDWLSGRWQRWEHDPHTTVYVAREGGGAAAWIIYNPESSMIEEVLTAGGGQSDGFLSAAIDR